MVAMVTIYGIVTKPWLLWLLWLPTIVTLNNAYSLSHFHSCLEGWLPGSKDMSVTCDRDGMWTPSSGGSYPRCDIVNCTTPQPVDHATFSVPVS